jgi:hypothetical protein
MWRQAFDRDVLGRGASGVRSYKISRPLNETNHVLLDLDFDTQEAAAEFLSRLRTDLWEGSPISQAVTGEPKTQMIETVANETSAVP